MSAHHTRDQFMRNAWEPIAIPRWALSAKYFLFTLAGFVAFEIGAPSIRFTTPQGYEPIWAAFVAGGGLLAFLGSLRPKWSAAEAIGGSFLLAFLAVLIVAVFIRGQYAVSLLLVVTYVVPATRIGFLVTRFIYKFRGVDL